MRSGRQKRPICPVRKAARRCGKNNAQAKRGLPSSEEASTEITNEGPTVEA
ncbi:MAG: hypothetical protein ACLT0Y_05960 [Christensenellales bacterium]